MSSKRLILSACNIAHCANNNIRFVTGIPIIHKLTFVQTVSPRWLSVRHAATQPEIDEKKKKYKDGKFDLPDPEHLAHFRKSDKPEVKDEKPATMQGAQETRIIFLETVAGVPGMVAAMTRHLHSLRRLQRDFGWIHTLLEEAENERMHLMTALQLRQPGFLFRGAIIGAQGTFVTMFSLAYLISPRFCHRFVGYLEEEAVKTYTKCLQDIDSGNMQHWQRQPSPDLAIRYWKLAPEATMRDVILAIRADEAHHRVVNHTLASMNETDYNPYKPGK
ncbi:AOX-like protein [Mya arenaria]|uniref:AOX-like protein n=1 Tax=Mya arenaria TaxID=6604 RepID=A0ABY7E4C5_MYAAR|nr:AOX-like protein [Mya arenaria]